MDNQKQEKLAAKIKGTLFLGFTYRKVDKKTGAVSLTRRNITVGAKIDKGFDKRGVELKKVGVTWGTTEGTRSCIQRNEDRVYVRGFENSSSERESVAPFKVFALDSIEGEIAGLE